MTNWKKTLEDGETNIQHYNKFCEGLISQHPDRIEISFDMVPVVSLSDAFIHAPYTPLTGDYICGFLGKIEVEVKHNLNHQVILKHIIDIGD